MTTPEPKIRLGQEVNVKCDSGEVAKGTVTHLQVYDIDRPVVLEGNVRTGDYIPGTGGIVTVTFQRESLNAPCTGGRRGREFYKQALLRAMGHDIAEWGMN